MTDPQSNLAKMIRARSLAAALVELAAHNIPTDIQELLIAGDPQRGIRPQALERAIITAVTAVLATSIAHQQPKASIQ